MIPTCHGDERERWKQNRRKKKKKPISFLDYNPNMIGVDLKDQLLHTNLLERKKMSKWYIRILEDYSIPQFWSQWLSAEQIHKRNELVTWSSEVTCSGSTCTTWRWCRKKGARVTFHGQHGAWTSWKKVSQRGLLWLIGSQDQHRSMLYVTRTTGGDIILVYLNEAGLCWRLLQDLMHKAQLLK
jgi:hypothetical protein